MSVVVTSVYIIFGCVAAILFTSNVLVLLAALTDRTDMAVRVLSPFFRAIALLRLPSVGVAGRTPSAHNA